MIDKKSEKWKIQPWWFKCAFFGVASRKIQLWLEFIALAVGIVLIFSEQYTHLSAAFILASYFTGWTIRYGDKKQVW